MPAEPQMTAELNDLLRAPRRKWWQDPAVHARMRAEFHPCETGVSIFQPEGGEFGGVTLKNYPGADPEVFRHMSSAGEGDDFDLVADVYHDGDLIDTVPIRRQDIDLIDRALLLSLGAQDD